MSSSRRRLERRSLSSPRWSMGDSLSSYAIGQGAAHLGRPLELQPVPGTFQDLEPVVTFHVTCGGFRAAPPEGWILVAPQQRCGHIDGAGVREPLPGSAARAEIGAVVVEGGGQAAGPCDRLREVIDHGLRHGLWIGPEGEHLPQPAVVVLGQHMLGLALHQEEPDVAGTRFLVFVVAACGCDRCRMSDREHRQRLRHLRMPRGEEPSDDRAPVVAGDVGRLAPEHFDERGHVVDEMADRVALLFCRRVGESVTTKVGRDREVSCLGDRVHLAQPGLGSLSETMQKDEHLTGRRAIDHGSESKAVRPDHVLARGHLICFMKSAATSRAWSSTARRPWPWPLKISRRALGMSLIFSFSKPMLAKGSRSPLMKSVGQRICGKCSVRSWSGNPGRCSGYEKRTRPPKSASMAAMLETRPPNDWPPPMTS